MTPAQIDFLAGRAEIALDAAPVAGEPALVARADGGDLHALRLLVREVVNPTHEADADETDAEHDAVLKW